MPVSKLIICLNGMVIEVATFSIFLGEYHHM